MLIRRVIRDAAFASHRWNPPNVLCPIDTAVAPDLPVDNLKAWLDRHRHWVFLGLLLLYVAGFNAQWRIGSDSALYATIGRNLAEGAGFTSPAHDASQVHPGLPVLLGGVFTLFGPGVTAPAVALLWLTALATLTLVYRLIELHADRPTAVAILLFLGVNRTFYLYSHQILTDIPFLFGLALFLLGDERLRHPFRIAPSLALMLIGLLVMASFRSVFLTVLGAAGASLLIEVVRGGWRGRARLVFWIAAIGVAILSLLYLLDPRSSSGPRDEQLALQLVQDGPARWLQRLDMTVPKLFEDALPQAVFGIEWGPGLNTLVTILVVMLGVGLARRRPLWGLLVAAFLAQFLLFYVTVRYFLPILPLLAVAWWRAAEWVQRRQRRWAPALAVIMVAAWIAPNLVRTLDIVIEQRQTPFIQHYSDGRYATLRDGAGMLAELTPPDALVLYTGVHAEELTYWSRRRVIKRHRVHRVDWSSAPAYLLADDPAAAGSLVGRLGLEMATGPATPIALAPDENWTLIRLRPAGRDGDVGVTPAPDAPATQGQ